MKKTRAVKVGPVTLRRWAGPAWRADGGYSSRLSAAEEAEEFLRQQDQPEPWHTTMRELIPFMRGIPQRDVFWVGKTKAAVQDYADRYDVEAVKFDLPYGVIIGEDGDGGYLVIRDVNLIRRPRR